MNNYLQEIAVYYKDLNSSEHSYRTSFENYLKEIFPTKDGYFTQQDQKAINGNKPDFVILKNKVPVLYIEVKKVGEDLDKIEKSNQADRYFGYDNLIISDYVDFRFFRNGQKHSEPITLGQVDKKSRTVTVTEKDKNIDTLTNALLDFTLSHKEPIKSGNQLARIMGGKAQRIRDNVLDMLGSDSDRYADLDRIQKVVEENLIHGLTNDDFADMYAQTLVYGLFAARYNDSSLDTFSRSEARDLVPKTNPFLASFFDHIAGASFPERLRFIVDELCEVFSHADVHKLLTDFYGKEKDNKDPIIHFYEDFLREYDAKKKMDMGVFYTPRPVVDFIIRGVDDILKTEFGIAKGLSDTEKINIEKKEIDPRTGKEIKVNKEFHRVQILDIATGTGTFLNQTIEHIYKGFIGQEGRWNSYVKENLLPRLHGFELMMASYTIAHLKLGMTLYDTGATDINQRLGVYLTNTLDTPVDYANQGTLFGLMDSIASEAKDASRIKSEYPIMCVIGNPPYSGISQNKNYTDNTVYKVEPGGTMKLQERKHWLDDDYVKFIRFGESLIEKNGEGIIGMITAHGYIDNPTFRGMRWHLRKTFDKIYIVDLHGNSNKKETSPDGSKDENVFDIKTGVSIIFGVKSSKSSTDKKLATVYKTDIYGIRRDKFSFIENANISHIDWTKLPADTDLWILEGAGKSEYVKGFSVADIFTKNTTGIVTGIDRLSIFETKEELEKTTQSILSSSDPYTEFGIKDGRRTKKEDRLKELRRAVENNTLTPISYRPFDTRYMYYTTGSEVWINSPRPDVMQHFVDRENIGLVFARTQKNPTWNALFISQFVIETKLGEASTQSATAPLYLYTNQNEKIPNLDKEIWDKINEVVGQGGERSEPPTTPENILDYIYAVLHSPAYREKYKEFLKIDFPRVPYPTDKENFWKLVQVGEKLRGLHLMTDSTVNEYITTYPVGGDDMVEKISYRDGNVYINTEQYFGNVPEIAWSFYIGGYQPAQKYLKDRKGRKLSNDEIEQYQRIVKVLVETDKVTREIDMR
jgi:predicted helicase